VSSNSADGEVYSIQHYMIKFVSDLLQVFGFLLVPLFPRPIKLLKVVLNTIQIILTLVGDYRICMCGGKEFSFE